MQEKASQSSKGRPVILGSQSPRRREILSYFTLPFVQQSPAFDESSIPYRDNPGDYVCTLAKGKSRAIEAGDEEIVVTADSVVIYENKVFGKPRDENEAFEMLSTLCGNRHKVYTGISVRKGSVVYSDFEMTKVWLNELQPAQIKAYQKRCHSIDKAAGYAIQREGSIIVQEIQGCFYNVMGLPVNTLRELLMKVGIDLWDYIA
jgi:septum formation protein